MEKFEGVDLARAMDAIARGCMAADGDGLGHFVDRMKAAARGGEIGERRFLWLCRPNGMLLVNEQQAYIQGTAEHRQWRYFAEQTPGWAAAYAVEVAENAEGVVKGNIYELDYPAHARRVRDAAMEPSDTLVVHYVDGGRQDVAVEDRALLKYSAREIAHVRCEARSADDMEKRMRAEHEGVERGCTPGEVDRHARQCREDAIGYEVASIRHTVLRLGAPNSQDGRGYVVPVSRYVAADAVALRSVAERVPGGRIVRREGELETYVVVSADAGIEAKSENTRDHRRNR